MNAAPTSDARLAQLTKTSAGTPPTMITHANRGRSGRSPVPSYQARVNGQEVGDLEAYRTPLFTLTFVEDNLLGVEPGVAQAMSLDYGFVIARLHREST